MINIEEITLDGKQFRHIYSDAGMKVLRDDGALYDDILSVSAGHTYTESEYPIDTEMEDADEADYIEALNELGVKTND